MASIGVMLMVAAAALHAVREIREDPAIDRRFVGRTLAAAAVFLLYVVGGAVAFVGLLADASPTGLDAEAAGGLAVLFLLGWVAYGTVLLIRGVPRRREPPKWVLRVGWVDAGLLLLTLGAAAALIAAG